MTDEECVFCAIGAGTAESSPVYADDDLLVFMALEPVTPGHLLVVPRRHVVGLDDLDGATGDRIWRTARRMARALRRSGLDCEGVNVFLADGAAAGQEVFHLHLHVFPRYAGDSFRLDADWATAPRAELDRTAEALVRALDALPDGSGR